MAVTQNKLLPLLGVVGLVIVGTVLYQQATGSAKPVASGDPMTAIPAPPALPKVSSADADTPGETLNTVVASNRELRAEVDKVLENNRRLEDENQRLKRGTPSLNGTQPLAPAGAAPVAPGSEDSVPKVRPASTSAFEAAIDSAGRAAESLMSSLPTGAGPSRPTGTPSQSPSLRQGSATGALPPAAVGVDSDLTQSRPAGAVSYATRPPMGYELQEDKSGQRGAGQMRYVRSLSSSSASPDVGSPGTAATAAQTAQAKPVPYFTIPENATLTGVRAMTSLIGRVPIDGRVTDPMQFKAMVGRENLAANGWELPDDLAGIIVTGVAIGDMALSCSEGKVKSLTFVFNDGTIRTVSSRARATSGGSGVTGELGYLSDPHGNPCISGKFVSNAPAYLSDMVGLKTLGVAGKAYAEAQRLVTNGSEGSSTSQIQDPNRYAMGAAVDGATEEITKWMFSRLKNSFDAVVTPAGPQLENLFVHIDQEVQLDKYPEARRLVHRTQASVQSQRGAHHGLE